MTRLTFGITSSPFLAMQAHRLLAKDYKSKFPRASEIIEKQFYVDDCITCADTEAEARDIQQELNDLLDQGKMTLRKWRTNLHVLLDSIPQERRSIHLTPHLIPKALGISTGTLSWPLPLQR